MNKIKILSLLLLFVLFACNSKSTMIVPEKELCTADANGNGGCNEISDNEVGKGEDELGIPDESKNASEGNDGDSVEEGVEIDEKDDDNDMIGDDIEVSGFVDEQPTLNIDEPTVNGQIADCQSSLSEDQLIDDDQDTLFNLCDNCPNISNSDQADIDGDGIGDMCGDIDGDGLTDSEEINEHGSNPRKSDTDDDTISDFEEVKIYRSDPTKGDSDEDGIFDNEEVKLGTDINDNDTDNDGLTDGTEVSAGMNPITMDTDSDGFYDDIDKNPLSSDIPNNLSACMSNKDSNIYTPSAYATRISFKEKSGYNQYVIELTSTNDGYLSYMKISSEVLNWSNTLTIVGRTNDFNATSWMVQAEYYYNVEKSGDYIIVYIDDYNFDSILDDPLIDRAFNIRISSYDSESSGISKWSEKLNIGKPHALVSKDINLNQQWQNIICAS